MSGWLSGFLNPGLIAGLALAGVPLIIHLLNRQRHRPVRWAAMRFVLAAYKKTRRRVQMENLLLLLLRMAVIALLALAVARPFTGRKSPLAMLTESRRDVVLVLDASASTGYREDVETVYERIVDRARTIVRDLEGGRGDRVRLILASSYPRLLSWTSPDHALSMLDTLSVPSDEPFDLAAALGEVLDLAQEEAAGAGQSGLEVRLLTDLQRRSLMPTGIPTSAGLDLSNRPAPSPSGAPEVDGPDASNVSGAEPEDAPSGEYDALFEHLDALAALGLRVIAEDLGPPHTIPPNLGIASVKPLASSVGVVGVGATTDISVDVMNHGDAAKSAVRVVLYVDDQRRPNQTIDVPAHGHAEAIFPVTFSRPGQHVLRAVLDGDRLTIDDSREEVLNVPPPVRVLLVNGAPSAREIDQDETGYLAAVLTPVLDDGRGLGEAEPFRPVVIEPFQLGTEEGDPAQFDVVWLANVESVPTRAIETLEAHVAGGGALIVSLGDKIDSVRWTGDLFRADGTGLLPARLGQRIAIPDRRQGYFRVQRFDEEHPSLSFFAEDSWKPLLTEVPIYEFIASSPGPGARVLATLDDDGQSPLLIERNYDRGRVLLWTTTIDPAWTRLPESPRTLIPFVHELVRHAAHAEPPPRNVSPGEPLIAEVEGFPRSLLLVRPDATQRRIEGEADEVTPGRYRLPPVSGRDTDRVGHYRLQVEGKTPATVSFAVQVDPHEGDLARLTAAEVQGLHPALVAIAPGDEERAREEGSLSGQGELWRKLAFACLLALVLESLWAAWLGQRRRVA
jgi:hypothetical protein